MAKISVEFDTVSKVLVASVDGTALENVVGINLSPSWDDPGEYCCSITTKNVDAENDIKTYTQLMASESKDAKSAKPSKISGFHEKSVENTRLTADILAYLKPE